MKAQLLAVATCLSALYACKNDASTSTKENTEKDQQFSNYSAHFIDDLWKNNPDWATSVGYHAYDSVLVIPDSASRQSYQIFIKTQLDSLKAFNPDELSAANKTDYFLVKSSLEESRWSLDS
eukprot:gene11597-15490_t